MVSPWPWAAQPGGLRGQCPPLLGPAGYRGRSNENDLCFYSRQSLFSTVQSNFNIFNRPLLILVCLYPHIWKSGGSKIFCSLRSRILFCTPHLKIRGAAPAPDQAQWTPPWRMVYGVPSQVVVCTSILLIIDTMYISIALKFRSSALTRPPPETTEIPLVRKSR